MAASMIGSRICWRFIHLALNRTLWKDTFERTLPSTIFPNHFIQHSCPQCHSIHMSSTVLKKRKTAEERKAPRIIQYTPKAKMKTEKIVDVWRNMTVSELSESMGKDLDHIFEVMMYVDNSVDFDKPDSIITNTQVVQDIVKKSGMRMRIVPQPDKVVPEEKNRDAVRRPPADLGALVSRPAVVTVMGHVDHGKTTLLDSLRNTSVVATEFGGITQHIGAFSVKLQSSETITFLDTPGHAAFSAMRARGAEVTDLVILVVAADDGVMEQTVESIRMAKDANVPIIVAINKIDKPEADIERTKRMLVQHGIQVEDSGGDVQTVPISALKGTNLDLLAETVVLQAEIMNLKGEPQGLVEGVVIESQTDAHRGKLSTAIIKRGTLRKGCIIVAGTAWARVRGMFDEGGRPIQEAPPSTPVEIIGWRELPSAGEEILEVESEKRANEVIRWRNSFKIAEKQEIDQEVVDAKHKEHLEVYKAQLQKKRLMGRFKMRRVGPREKEISNVDRGSQVSVIVKADVDGSVEAILDVLETYSGNALCKLDLVHYGVGNVTETDLELADAFKALVYSFNLATPSRVQELAKTKGVTIKLHNIIYRLVDDLKKEISSKLPLKEVEEILGEANVLQDFEVTEGKKKVHIAGCRCTKGVLKKSGQFRVLRREDVIYDGAMESLRHLKNEVDSIKKDVECGLRLSDSSIEYMPGDTVLCYEVKKLPQETDWDPGF